MRMLLFVMTRRTHHVVKAAGAIDIELLKEEKTTGTPLDKGVRHDKHALSTTS